MKIAVKTLTFLCFLVLMLSIDLVDKTPSRVVFVRQAEAIIGMPLTPLSYAGVARRTARRTAYATAAVASTEATAAAVAAASAPTTVIVTQAPAVPIGTILPALPAGSTSVVISGANYFTYGGVYYKPAFQGNNLIYVVVQKP